MKLTASAGCRVPCCVESTRHHLRKRQEALSSTSFIFEREQTSIFVSDSLLDELSNTRVCVSPRLQTLNEFAL